MQAPAVAVQPLKVVVQLPDAEVAQTELQLGKMPSEKRSGAHQEAKGKGQQGGVPL